MEEQNCKWKSKYFPEYKCNEVPLSKDVRGYCILHSEDEKKDFEIFVQKIAERRQAHGLKRGVIDLQGCYFPKGFLSDYFKDENFYAPVDFTECTFSQEALFGGSEFRNNVLFMGTKFLGSACFDESVFSEQGNFYRATFFEESFFCRTKFKEVIFSEAKFNEKVNFSESSFNEAFFNRTTFSKRAKFIQTKFSGNVYFLATSFESGAIFNGSNFKDVVFASVEDCKERVTLGPLSSFQSVHFVGEVRFQEVDLSHCSFLHSNIAKVDFRYCEFNKPHRRQNVLRDELDADEAVGAGLKPAPTFRVRMTDKEKVLRENKYEPVRRLYLELKRNFEEKKDWNTAGDFHYGEMECRRKGRLGGWLDFLLVTTYYRASGYGERPLRAFIVLCLLAFLVFPLFLSVNDFWPYISGKQPFCFWNCAGEFFDSLKNSLRVATFTTVTKIGKEIYPDNGWDWVILVLESIFVYIQIFLLALALRRKVKR